MPARNFLPGGRVGHLPEVVDIPIRGNRFRLRRSRRPPEEELHNRIVRVPEVFGGNDTPNAYTAGDRSNSATSGSAHRNRASCESVSPSSWNSPSSGRPGFA